MDNEKYGIELELITNKFNQTMQKVKSAFSSLTDKKVNLTTNTAQINYLKAQINDITERIRRIDKGFETGDVLKLEAQLEKLKNQYNEIIAKQNQLSFASSKATSGVTKGLEKMTSKIKRFGFSLLSIRSAYLLVSRASSAYMAQDTALANKLQSVWAGLGALLAPAIEFLVNLFAKAIKYIAIFIKALTGVDLLARASAKSMAGTAKAAKALNKALAGFDELQNLDTEAGGGATDIGAGLSGLEDVKINTEWADKIKSFGVWIKTNWKKVLAGFAGLVTFMKTLAPLVEKLGLKIGFIKSLGIGLIVAGVTQAIISLIKYLKDPSWENFGDIIQGIGIAVLGLGVAFLGLPGIIAGVITIIVGTILKYWDKTKETLQNGLDWFKSKTDWVEKYFGVVGKNIYVFWINTWQGILDFLNVIFTSIKGIFDGLIKVIKGVFTGDWKLAWEGLKQIALNIFNALYQTIIKKTQEIGTKVGQAIGGAFKSAINAVFKTIENVLNAPIRAVNALIDVINKVPGINLSRLSTFNLPRLATGTNYVPEDQIAMIHKGEAVVPKKFNSREYFGNNEETNSLLQELIEAVGNIEINPYTTIKDVGKASLSYINNKSRQLGESVVI